VRIFNLIGAGANVIFHPWVTRGYPKFKILMFSIQPAHLNFRQAPSFGTTQQYPLLMSRTVTLGDIHLTHQSRSSLGAPIRHDLVIEFTSTLLKPVGDPKPDRCEHGCDFSPAGVAMGGFGWVSQVWPRAGFVKPVPSFVPSPPLSSQN
jgi:hypothetical protein